LIEDLEKAEYGLIEARKDVNYDSSDPTQQKAERRIQNRTEEVKKLEDAIDGLERARENDWLRFVKGLDGLGETEISKMLSNRRSKSKLGQVPYIGTIDQNRTALIIIHSLMGRLLRKFSPGFPTRPVLKGFFLDPGPQIKSFSSTVSKETSYSTPRNKPHEQPNVSMALQAPSHIQCLRQRLCSQLSPMAQDGRQPTHPPHSCSSYRPGE
jgi:hypothetical protein